MRKIESQEYKENLKMLETSPQSLHRDNICQNALGNPVYHTLSMDLPLIPLLMLATRNVTQKHRSPGHGSTLTRTPLIPACRRQRQADLHKF